MEKTMKQIYEHTEQCSFCVSVIQVIMRSCWQIKTSSTHNEKQFDGFHHDFRKVKSFFVNHQIDIENNY